MHSAWHTPHCEIPWTWTSKVREESGVVWHCALLVVGPLQLGGWQVWWTCQGSCKSLYTRWFLVWYNTKQLVISSHYGIVYVIFNAVLAIFIITLLMMLDYLVHHLEGCNMIAMWDCQQIKCNNNIWTCLSNKQIHQWKTIKQVQL